MASRLLTLAVWAVVLASAVFWGMKVFASRTGVPPQAQMPARAVAMGGELRKLLGASEKPQDDEEQEMADAGGRFQLLGVVAPRGAGRSPQGVALIAVSDEPPKAYRTGSVVDGDTVLLAVNQRSVQLGPAGGPATTELTLPEPTPIAAPPRTVLSPGQRPVPMMPSGAPQVAPGVHPPAAPSAQPMQRAGQPAQQEDEESDEDQ